MQNLEPPKSSAVLRIYIATTAAAIVTAIIAPYGLIFIVLALPDGSTYPFSAETWAGITFINGCCCCSGPMLAFAGTFIVSYIPLGMAFQSREGPPTLENKVVAQALIAAVTAYIALAVGLFASSFLNSVWESPLGYSVGGSMPPVIICILIGIIRLCFLKYMRPSIANRLSEIVEKIADIVND